MVHTLCSTPRADNTCKDTNFFLNIRKGEAEKFAMAGFLVPHVSQKRWGRMHCHSKKFAIFAGKTITDGVGQKMILLQPKT